MDNKTSKNKRDEYEALILASHRIISDLYKQSTFITDNTISEFCLLEKQIDDYNLQLKIIIKEDENGEVSAYVLTSVDNKNKIELLGTKKCVQYSIQIREDADCTLLEMGEGKWEIKADQEKMSRTADELYEAGVNILETGGEEISYTRKKNPDNEYIEKVAVALMSLIAHSSIGAEKFINLLEETTNQS